MQYQLPKLCNVDGTDKKIGRLVEMIEIKTG
jgi:hypothetical protein